VQELTTDAQRRDVNSYIEQTKHKSELERIADQKKKTGAFTGSYAQHPITGKPLPIWIADFVLATYGTGAIMHFILALGVLSYVQNYLYIIPLALGSWVGTFLVVNREQKKWQK
jgi:hypothetical protein